MPGSRRNWNQPEVVCKVAWALLISTVVDLSVGSGAVCVNPRTLAAPVTYIGPKNGATSRCHGSGLATSGPAIDGVAIAVGPAGAAGAASAAAGAPGAGAPAGGGA